MKIQSFVLEQVARGLRSKNLIFNQEFISGKMHYWQQIFRNKKNGLVVKQYVKEGNHANITACGYSGNVRVLGHKDKTAMPLFEYAKKESLEQSHIPYNIVSTASPNVAVNTTAISIGDNFIKSSFSARKSAGKVICSDPHLNYSSTSQFVENNGMIMPPLANSLVLN